MAIIKRKNWAKWREGAASKMIKAGGESLSTGIGTMLGTNGLANIGIDALKDIGMGWKTMCVAMLVQFLLRVVKAGADYASQTEPDEIEEEVPTAQLTRSDLGLNNPEPPQTKPIVPP